VHQSDSLTKYCDVLPGNVTVISGFWILLYISIYWINHQAELQLIITPSILLWAHCVNSNVFLVPIHCLVCILLPRLLFTHHWTVSAFTSRLLLQTELAENWLILNGLQKCPELHYIAPALTAQKAQLYCWLALAAQKTSHAAAIVAWRLTAAEMCLPLHCIATSEARHGYSFYCCVYYPAMSNKHSYFYCCMRVSRFLHLTVLAWGKHATISFTWLLK
jgi:hypothetical protein